MAKVISHPFATAKQRGIEQNRFAHFGLPHYQHIFDFQTETLVTFPVLRYDRAESWFQRMPCILLQQKARLECQVHLGAALRWVSRVLTTWVMFVWCDISTSLIDDCKCFRDEMTRIAIPLPMSLSHGDHVEFYAAYHDNIGHVHHIKSAVCALLFEDG